MKSPQQDNPQLAASATLNLAARARTSLPVSSVARQEHATSISGGEATQSQLGSLNFKEASYPIYSQTTTTVTKDTALASNPLAANILQ